MNTKGNEQKTPPENEKRINTENMLIKMVRTIKKVTQVDFYHVNFDKITLYVFNYTSGYVEEKKGHNYKISHITYLMEKEKEKHKNSASLNIQYAKLMKGKKKGNANKKEENEINPHDNTSAKLKEIYRALSSKDCEQTIKKLFMYSILIFILIGLIILILE